MHDSVQNKFVSIGSRLVDLKPYVLLGAKVKQQYVITTGLCLTGWSVLVLPGEALCSEMLLGESFILCHEKKYETERQGSIARMKENTHKTRAWSSRTPSTQRNHRKPRVYTERSPPSLQTTYFSLPETCRCLSTILSSTCSHKMEVQHL